VAHTVDNENNSNGKTIQNSVAGVNIQHIADREIKKRKYAKLLKNYPGCIFHGFQSQFSIFNGFQRRKSSPGSIFNVEKMNPGSTFNPVQNTTLHRHRLDTLMFGE
jgi:hypothetical protein